jgi:hypothetical protein
MTAPPPLAAEKRTSKMTPGVDHFFGESGEHFCKHESFRLKEKRRAGLLDKSAPADPGRTSAP